MKYLLFIAINTISWTCLSQEITVIKSKNIFIGDEKVKKGDILTNETLYFEKNGKITLTDNEITFEYKSYTPSVKVDSVYQYFKKHLSIGDSLAKIVNCQPSIKGKLNTGAVEVSGFEFEVLSITKNISPKEKYVDLQWKPLMLSNEKKYNGSYYIILKDIHGLTLEVLKTSDTGIRISLDKFQYQPIIVYKIKTLDPCGESNEYAIGIQWK